MSNAAKNRFQLIKGMVIKFLGNLLVHFLLLLVVIAVLAPFVWMLSGSFKSTNEIQAADFLVPGKEPRLIPWKPTFENYLRINKTVPMLDYLFNSLVISIGSMILSVLISLFASYALARFRFAWKKTYEVILYSTQMFPGIAFLIPYFIIFIFIKQKTGIQLQNTYVGMIFTYTSFALPFAILMLQNYISTIPVEIDEQAHIDGCNRFQTLFYIIYPLAIPGISSVGIYSFLMAWSEMLFASVLTNTETRTVSLGLMDYITLNSAVWGGMMAGCIIVILPVLILFIFLQKKVITGITDGAVKS